MIDEKTFRTIVNIVNEKKELIIHEYKDKKDMILFPKELVKEFHHVVEEFVHDVKDIKVLYKTIIKQFLNLSDSDVIVSKNGHYIIKKFDKKKREDPSKERRFDGINEVELKSFYDEFFSEQESKKVFLLTAKEFVKTLDMNKVTNDKYEKSVFGDIQLMICKYLTTKYDNSKEFFHGFSGYFFRIHFEDVFGYIADSILYEVANVNEHITEFIKYYSGNIIVVHGKKYRVPSIQTHDGVNWNISSILSIAKKYFKAQEYRNFILEDIKTLKEENSKLLVDGISPIQHQKNITQKLKELNSDMKALNRELEINSDALTLSKTDAQQKELVTKISGIKNAIHELENKIERTDENNVDDKLIEKYTKSQKALDLTVRDLKNQERTLSQNMQLYNSMRKSLVKALIAKKKLL